MNTTQEARDLVERVVTSLCHGVIQRVDEFRIVRGFEGDSVTLWNLECSTSDRGRIIGRGGDRFRALRHVVRTIGRSFGHECKLGELKSGSPAIPQPFPPFSYNPNWPKNEVLQLAEATACAMFGPQARAEIAGTHESTVIRIFPGTPLNASDHRMTQESLSNIFSGIGTTHGAEISVDLAR